MAPTAWGSRLSWVCGVFGEGVHGCLAAGPGMVVLIEAPPRSSSGYLLFWWLVCAHSL